MPVIGTTIIIDSPRLLLAHPHMDILEQRMLMGSLVADLKFRGILMQCCSLWDANNVASYNQASRMISNDRLFILVNVDDALNKTKIPTTLALRLFNADITC